MGPKGDEEETQEVTTNLAAVKETDLLKLHGIFSLKKNKNQHRKLFLVKKSFCLAQVEFDESNQPLENFAYFSKKLHSGRK